MNVSLFLLGYESRSFSFLLRNLFPFTRLCVHFTNPQTRAASSQCFRLSNHKFTSKRWREQKYFSSFSALTEFYHTKHCLPITLSLDWHPEKKFMQIDVSLIKHHPHMRNACDVSRFAYARSNSYRKHSRVCKQEAQLGFTNKFEISPKFNGKYVNTINFLNSRLPRTNFRFGYSAAPKIKFRDN